VGDTTPNSAPARQATAEVIHWSVWPARRAPLLALMVGGFIIVFSLVVQLVFRSTAYTFVSLAFLTLASGPFLFATRYRVDAEGVEVLSPFMRRRRNWEAFKRYAVDCDGVLLTPFTRPHALAATRGLYLRFDRGDIRDQVMTLVARRLPALNADD